MLRIYSLVSKLLYKSQGTITSLQFPKLISRCFSNSSTSHKLRKLMLIKCKFLNNLNNIYRVIKFTFMRLLWQEWIFYCVVKTDTEWWQTDKLFTRPNFLKSLTHFHALRFSFSVFRHYFHTKIKEKKKTQIIRICLFREFSFHNFLSFFFQPSKKCDIFVITYFA